jgi:xylan 1,4-beta-xylosidase
VPPPLSPAIHFSLIQVHVLSWWLQFPGATGGTAIAEAVFGEQNRFGKLPFTWYASNFTAASDFDNMNMTDGPGRTYKYLKDARCMQPSPRGAAVHMSIHRCMHMYVYACVVLRFRLFKSLLVVLHSLALWPFGYGLSYTTFTLTDATAHNPTPTTTAPAITTSIRAAPALAILQVAAPHDSLEVSVRVTNTGSVTGDEVVFLFKNSSAVE